MLWLEPWPVPTVPAVGEGHFKPPCDEQISWMNINILQTCDFMVLLWRYVLLHHVMGELEKEKGAWGYVEGGMGGVSKAIASAAQSFGVDIFTEKVMWGWVLILKEHCVVFRKVFWQKWNIVFTTLFSFMSHPLTIRIVGCSWASLSPLYVHRERVFFHGAATLHPK